MVDFENAIKTISVSDICILDDVDDTLFASIKMPSDVANYYAHIFDSYQSEYENAEVTRDYIFCEWHKDNGEFIYWLDLDNNIDYINDSFRCDYINNLLLYSAATK